MTRRTARPGGRCGRSRGVAAPLLALALAALAAAPRAHAQPGTPEDPIVVASKTFGESYILAELFAQQLEAAGFTVARRIGLGATEVVYGALRRDAVDVYPEYTGTGLVALLRDSLPADRARDRRAVYAHVAARAEARDGTRWLPPLGFENTYAIAVQPALAERESLRTLADLARIAPSLTAGFTADFADRPDGLPALAATYGMRFRSVRPLGESLKYRALDEGAVDVIDGYSTDGLLARFDLTVLADVDGAFPPYDAVPVTSPRLARERPAALAALAQLAGRIDARRMRAWNARLEVDREPVARIAADIRRELGLAPDTAVRAAAGATAGAAAATGDDGLLAYLLAERARIGRRTVRHLQLVGLALGAAILVAVPLGLALALRPRAGEPLLAPLAVVQTVPSIALLAFMLPLFGIGVRPALVALWLYALYPVARATYAGVRAADPDADFAARALGMTEAQRLLHVRLPLAAPAILAGVRTAAAITVGAATLAAFIGAGGLGEPIVRGLALADTRQVLAGAIPAALLAVLLDGALLLVERAATPPHLRRERVRG